MGGLPLKNIIARGLTMGDEMHQRNVACSGLTLRALAPALAETSDNNTELAKALAFIAGNDQFFLNIAMTMGKSITDPARGIEGSSIVTALSRNGTNFGIRVSGTRDQWFTAPVEMPEGLYFPGYTEADANPDMGDSAIVETIGLGGFAMGASPAVAGFVGAGAASSYTKVRAMVRVATPNNEALLLEQARTASGAALETICSRYSRSATRRPARFRIDASSASAPCPTEPSSSPSASCLTKRKR